MGFSWQAGTAGCTEQGEGSTLLPDAICCRAPLLLWRVPEHWCSRTCCADVSRGQCLYEGCCVHQAAAAYIDQHCTRLHELQPAGTAVL